MSEGASSAEQILESARRNNTELLSQIAEQLGSTESLAALLNSTHEVVSGNTPLHIAAERGNWEFLDVVLDVEGVELDPRNRANETPLHLATKYALDEPEHGRFIVDNFIDAGASVAAVDGHGLKAVNYAKDPELRQMLESAEYGAAADAVADGEDDDDDEALASESE